ncbi:short chain enoyl-CoA hydratase /Enoyl-CoA hydratase [Sphingomonas laterariae]|uniref:Short chain enoyl-CoA hydratase /Enoyl-CoA hydratase n=1 Tax=Edaphosphingomonas laterariae TaxID=861865 RepID=A0A239C7B1_9SPHN|nr:enoyl-CoA hydratase-related protein [Sphingomonas laterariae]SNS16000.1 short chain enoyl-CoA hydratase /Enoyl-CoA hydratase [Sphingomonas laterariae]
MAEEILLERDGAIAILTIANPARRNAFTPDMRRALSRHLEVLATDPDCRAIILAGADGHFCAGADLSRVDPAQPPMSAIALRENTKQVHQLVRALFSGPKPVIAAVEGLAFGGGLGLALACDHVVAARTARFGAAFAKVGIIADVGVLHTLQIRLGVARAKRFLALGEQVDGEAAVRIGLADDLAETGAALATAKQVAGRYAEAAPLSIAYTKAAYARGLETLEDTFQAELDYLPLTVASEDFREALTAFREKRPPRFTGQ